MSDYDSYKLATPPEYEDICKECGDLGFVIDAEGRDRCTDCVCSVCEQVVGKDNLLGSGRSKVCFGCTPAKCEGCGVETNLAKLSNVDDRCEDCSVEGREE